MIKKKLLVKFVLAKIGLTLGDGVRINLRGGGVGLDRVLKNLLVLSKSNLFQEFWQGWQKKSGRVDPREEMNPSPQKIVGLRTFSIIWYFLQNLHTKLWLLGPPIVIWDTSLGGWVGCGVYVVGGSVVESMLLGLVGRCEQWLYSLAQNFSKREEGSGKKYLFYALFFRKKNILFPFFSYEGFP